MSRSEVAAAPILQKQSPNYRYLVEWIIRNSGETPTRALDYGCGRGTSVAQGRARGLDIHGADTFEGIYAGWKRQVDPAAADHIRPIVQGRIDAPDEHFDLIVSNFVFEHIADPPSALTEIARVLRPGGKFLAIFPSRDVWFEGHLGLYFVHWLSRWPRVQRAYMRAARRLGFGYYLATLTPEAWAERMQHILDSAVFHHDMRDVRRWWRAAFDVEPVSDASTYMRYRLEQSRFAALASLADVEPTAALLRFVCRIRAGRVLVVQKPPSGAQG